MAVDDAGEHVGEIGLRIDAAQLAGLDQRGDHRPVLPASVGAGEERVFTIEGDRADRTLDGIRVDLDPAVVEETREAGPVREGVADDLGELALLADEGEPVAQPRVESDDERTRSFLADGASLVWPATANVGLDPIERSDALQRLRCDRRSLRDEAFVEAAPQV